MIEMLEGVPGSGKSYYAVSERLLKWVRAGRRVYVFVDGFYLDRLALFEGVELTVLQQQITLWQSGEEVKAGLLEVEPGSAVLIDEVQTVFRSKDKTDPQLLRWLETHRHRGIDLVLMCQQYGQVTLGRESVGGSHHEVSPAGSVRLEESLSGLGARESGRARSDSDVLGQVRTEAVRLLFQLCLGLRARNGARRLHVEESDIARRDTRVARGGRMVCLWRLALRGEAGPSGSRLDDPSSSSAAFGSSVSAGRGRARWSCLRPCIRSAFKAA